MTQNQIAYHNAIELERHNKATEQETSRHQLVQEALTKWANALTKYQIAVNNAHYVRQDNETKRANLAREAQNAQNLQLSAANLAETNRTNIANESIRRQANAIQSASVAETSRHQKAMESIQSTLNASIIERNQADTGFTEARTQTENYSRIYLLPTQAQVNSSQANLNVERSTSEEVNRIATLTGAFNNLSSGIRNLGGVVSDFFKLGGSSSSPTEADTSRQFWKQLEVQINK